MVGPKSDPSLAESAASLAEVDGPQGAAAERPPESGPRLDESRGLPRAVPAVAQDEGAPFDLGGEALVEPAPASSVGVSELRAYLGLPSTKKRVYDVVSIFVGAKTPKHVKDDIAQMAYLTALEAKSPPRSSATMPGWLSTVTRRAVFRFFRQNAAHLHWLNREADVEEQADEPGEPPEDRWLASRWLAPYLADDERDQQTYEMIAYKAQTGASDREVAEAHGLTYAAWTHRLSAFRKKYAPRWRRRQRFILLLVGGTALVALVLAWLVMRWITPRAAPVQRLQPAVPSASVVPAAPPAPAPFEPAAPTGPDKPKPGR